MAKSTDTPFHPPSARELARVIPREKLGEVFRFLVDYTDHQFNTRSGEELDKLIQQVASLLPTGSESQENVMDSYLSENIELKQIYFKTLIDNLRVAYQLKMAQEPAPSTSGVTVSSPSVNYSKDIKRATVKPAANISLAYLLKSKLNQAINRASKINEGALRNHMILLAACFTSGDSIMEGFEKAPNKQVYCKTVLAQVNDIYSPAVLPPIPAPSRSPQAGQVKTSSLVLTDSLSITIPAQGKVLQPILIALLDILNRNMDSLDETQLRQQFNKLIVFLDLKLATNFNEAFQKKDLKGKRDLVKRFYNDFQNGYFEALGKVLGDRLPVSSSNARFRGPYTPPDARVLQSSMRSEMNPFLSILKNATITQNIMRETPVSDEALRKYMDFLTPFFSKPVAEEIELNFKAPGNKNRAIFCKELLSRVPALNPVSTAVTRRVLKELQLAEQPQPLQPVETRGILKQQQRQQQHPLRRRSVFLTLRPGQVSEAPKAHSPAYTMWSREHAQSPKAVGKKQSAYEMWSREQVQSPKPVKKQSAYTMWSREHAESPKAVRQRSLHPQNSAVQPTPPKEFKSFEQQLKKNIPIVNRQYKVKELSNEQLVVQDTTQSKAPPLALFELTPEGLISSFPSEFASAVLQSCRDTQLQDITVHEGDLESLKELAKVSLKLRMHCTFDGEAEKTILDAGYDTLDAFKEAMEHEGRISPT